MVDEEDHWSIGALSCVHNAIYTALSKIELSNNTVIVLADNEAIVAKLNCRVIIGLNNTGLYLYNHVPIVTPAQCAIQHIIISIFVVFWKQISITYVYTFTLLA